MSGGSTDGYIPSQKTSFDCETGTIVTNVASIDLSVLSHHKVNDILDVILNNNSVTLENENGEILGSVLHPDVKDLIECLKKGNNYYAQIMLISGTICRVLISRK